MVPSNDPWKKCRLHPLDGATVASYDKPSGWFDAIHVITRDRKKGCGEVIVRRLVSHFSQSNSTIKKNRRCNVKSDSTESLGKYRFLLNWFISARHIQNAVTNLRSNEKRLIEELKDIHLVNFCKKKRNSYEVDIEQISTVLAFRWYELKKKGPPGATNNQKKRIDEKERTSVSSSHASPLSGRDFSPCESAPFQWKEKGSE